MQNGWDYAQLFVLISKDQNAKGKTSWKKM